MFRVFQKSEFRLCSSREGDYVNERRIVRVRAVFIDGNKEDRGGDWLQIQPVTGLETNIHLFYFILFYFILYK